MGAGADAAPPDAQGVTRCCCLKGVADDPDAAPGCNGGKLWTAEAREGPAWADVEAAARATRSKSWREDCVCERATVEFFALSTRPLVTPDHSEPVAVGTSSGN